MTEPLPADILTEPLANGTRYVLPIRDLGKEKYKAGWMMLGMGGFGTAFTCLWMGMPLAWGIPMVLEGEWFGLLLIGFAMLGLGGLRPSIGMLLMGITILTYQSRCIVELRNGKLYSIEKLVLFSLRRKRRIEKISRLTVEYAMSGNRSKRKQNRPSIDMAWGKQMFTIIAAGPDIENLKIAPGYPREMLTPLAICLAEKIEAEVMIDIIDPRENNKKSTPVPLSYRHADEVAQQSDQENDPEQADAPLQPANSSAAVERRSDGMTITIPPTGLWKGSGGLFFFSILWNGFIAVFIAVAISKIINGTPLETEDGGEQSPWFMLLFMIPFVAVGVGILLAAINLGKRKAIIDVVGDVLLLTRKSIFGTKQYEFTIDQIEKICSGPSGTEVNDVPVYELQIHPVTGKKVGLLSQRDDEELEWLAAEINQALGRKNYLAGDEPVVQAKLDSTGKPIQPATSEIAVEHQANGLTIAVPASGLKKQLVIFIMGLIFSALGFGVMIGVISSELKDGFQWSDLESIGFILLWGTLFGGVGLAMLISSVITARRTFLIDVKNNQLTVYRTGPFGKKEFNWVADQIDSVVVAKSGTKVNDKAFMQLQIIPKSGSTLKLMTGRSETELAYLAAEINLALGSK